jgi:membrane protein DedA with SNARE-associated domain
MFYIFLFLALLGTGVGLFPIPEDIIVLSAGVGIFEGEGEIFLVFLIILLGIIISDSLIFFAGRKLGAKIFNFKFLSFFFTQNKIEKVQKIFDSHYYKLIFGGRFASGFRPVILFTAGTSKVSYYAFFIIDFLASLIYIPFLLFFGYRFSYDLDRLVRGATRFYHIIEIVIILIIIGWLVFRLSKRIFGNLDKKNNLA